MDFYKKLKKYFPTIRGADIIHPATNRVFFIHNEQENIGHFKVSTFNKWLKVYDKSGRIIKKYNMKFVHHVTYEVSP